MNTELSFWNRKHVEIRIRQLVIMKHQDATDIMYLNVIFSFLH